MAQLDGLFAPCTVAGLNLANRIVMAPMTRSMSPAGVPGPEVAAYYARRAATGVGFIITEGTAVDRPGALDDPNVPHFHGAASLAGWKRVVEAVHAAGGKIAPQLWHVGAYAGRRSVWADGDPRIEGPSGLRGPGEPSGRVMSDSDIADTLDAYGKAARAAADLGFDAVEIHGAHGYLCDQFFWSQTNRRQDAFGGPAVADRARFAGAVVQAIRRAVPPDFPVLFRFSQFKQQDYAAKLAHTPDELAMLLQPLAAAGVDLFHASQRRFWEPEFSGSALNLAGWAKKVTGKPAITVGSVGLDGDYIGNREGSASAPAALDELLARLDRGEFDLVAVGRALLGDYDWAQKIRQGQTESLKSFAVADLQTYF